MVHGETDDISITDSSTLKEALSRMLGQGFHNMAVTDENNRLIGEVTLSDIETVIVNSER